MVAVVSTSDGPEAESVAVTFEFLSFSELLDILEGTGDVATLDHGSYFFVDSF